MIDIDKFMDDIHTPLVNHSNAEQLVKANQKPPTSKLKDNRTIYNMILFANTGSRHTIIKKKEVVESEDEDFDEDIEIENIFYPQATLSITSFNDTLSQINKLREWFYINGLGDWWLRDNGWNCVIRDVLEIEDRTTYLSSDYEKRFGFDVVLEFKDIVTFRHDTIEVVQITNKNTSQTKEIEL